MGDKFTNALVDALLQVFGSPIILCAIGSRMFFNLSEAAEHGVNVGTNWSSYSQTTIQFDVAQAPELQDEFVKCASLLKFPDSDISLCFA